jgi:hypothetical protein
MKRKPVEKDPRDVIEEASERQFIFAYIDGWGTKFPAPATVQPERTRRSQGSESKPPSWLPLALEMVAVRYKTFVAIKKI